MIENEAGYSTDGLALSAEERAARDSLIRSVTETMSLVRTMARRDDFNNGYSLAEIIEERVAQIGSSADGVDQFYGGIRTEISTLLLAKEIAVRAIDGLIERMGSDA